MVELSEEEDERREKMTLAELSVELFKHLSGRPSERGALHESSSDLATSCASHFPLFELSSGFFCCESCEEERESVMIRFFAATSPGAPGDASRDATHAGERGKSLRLSFSLRPVCLRAASVGGHRSGALRSRSSNSITSNFNNEKSDESSARMSQVDVHKRRGIFPRVRSRHFRHAPVISPKRKRPDERTFPGASQSWPAINIRPCRPIFRESFSSCLRSSASKAAVLFKRVSLASPLLRHCQK